MGYFVQSLTVSTATSSKLNSQLLQCVAVCLPFACGCFADPHPPVLTERPSKVEAVDQRPINRNQPAASRPQPINVSLDQLGFPSANERAADAPGQWTTELLTNQISARLNDISRAISADSIPAETFHEFVSTLYRSRPLRPAETKLAFEHGNLRVTRGNDDESSHSEIEQRLTTGALAFRDDLNAYRATLGEAAEIHCHYKTFRITPPDAQSVQSRSLFELNGVRAGIVFRQRAIWDCSWEIDDGDGPRLSKVAVGQFEETIANRMPDTSRSKLLEDATTRTIGHNSSFTDQLDFSTNYWLDRLEFRYGIDPGAWLGLAIADVNGDGLEDVYFCQPGGLPNRLYVQQSDGRATDQSSTANVDWLDHTHSALFVDLDNDADQDLVLAVKTGVLFLENDGHAVFETAAVRHFPDSTPYSLSAVDYDEDGLLDIYVTCYSKRKPPTERNFIQRPVPYHDANNGGRNQMLRNLGEWQFRDVTRSVGLDTNNRRFSFAASWEDFDNDGDLDVYVANDYGRNNLYRNDNRYFVDVAKVANVEDISAGMSVSWGDYNRDGWMDLYVSNMFSSAGGRIAYQRQFRETNDAATRAEYQRHARGNSLFLNNRDGTFSDVSEATKTTIGRWAWGSAFSDINNDGWQDILVANGFITQADSGDL